MKYRWRVSECERLHLLIASAVFSFLFLFEKSGIAPLDSSTLLFVSSRSNDDFAKKKEKTVAKISEQSFPLGEVVFLGQVRTARRRARMIARCTGMPAPPARMGVTLGWPW